MLYASLRNSDETIAKLEKELFFSIQRSYDLYHYLLMLVVEIGDHAESRIEIAKGKILATPEDLNPNTRFIDNKIIHALRVNKAIQNHASNAKLSWVVYPQFVKDLYAKMIEADFYKAYMENEQHSFDEDRKFINKLLAEIIAPSEDLHYIMEELSIFWNDDLEFVLNMLVKTVKKLKPDADEDTRLMPLYKNTEDYEFVKNLFRKAIINYDDNSKFIDSYTKNWDVDRIAQMDVIILNMALTELKSFPSIPVKVTLNEFIEVSKYYSTAKSNAFINGVLDRIIKDLKKDNKIVKVGRGLMEGK